MHCILLQNLHQFVVSLYCAKHQVFYYVQAMFSQCDMKRDFWILAWIQSEIFCLRAVFLACSLFSYECTYSELGNTYKQATRTALIPIISIGRQELEQRKVLKERVFMMFSFFGESNGFSFQNLAAFEVI